jgi:phosphoribosylanthranilate isomerase
MVRTRIKICGITREQDLADAVACGADALGFVLYPKSPRFVSLEQLRLLTRGLPAFVTPVLLFVNASPRDIAAALQVVPHALLQFHGDETPETCNVPQRPYLRAARMGAGFDLLDFASRYPQATGLLLDAHVEGYGGGGKQFDWSLLPPNVPLPLVLSGGLNAANVGSGIARVRPSAVDVSSGVESAKGIKDAALMRQFCQAVRDADSARLASV